MDIEGFTALLSGTGAIPQVTSVAQARHVFVQASGGAQAIDYAQHAHAIEMLQGSLEATWGPRSTARGRSREPRLGASTSEQMSVLLTPYVPGRTMHRSSSPPRDRVREMSLSQSMAVHDKQGLGPTLQPRRYAGSTVASRLRQAFTDQQSFRTLYEELLEENRFCAFLWLTLGSVSFREDGRKKGMRQDVMEGKREGRPRKGLPLMQT